MEASQAAISSSGRGMHGHRLAQNTVPAMQQSSRSKQELHHAQTQAVAYNADPVWGCLQTRRVRRAAARPGLVAAMQQPICRACA